MAQFLLAATIHRQMLLLLSPVPLLYTLAVEPAEAVSSVLAVKVPVNCELREVLAPATTLTESQQVTIE